MEERLEQLLDDCRQYTSEGKLAEYIPELAKMDKNQIGIYMIDNNGKEYMAGDYDKKFTIQSICKVILLMMALIDNGEEYVRKYIGVEATGKPFNAIDYSEEQKLTEHINPMVNIGAIAVCSMIKGKDYKEKFERILKVTRKLSNNSNIQANEDVYLSEKRTGSKNRALAYLLKSYEIINDDVEELLDTYFKACSIEVSCQDLANIGFVLANHGSKGIAKEKIIPSQYTRFVNAILMTCGMYDGAGDFAIRVGMPAKSGVGGGIMAVSPRRFGIGIYSPGLDQKGNSYAGIRLLENISNELYLSIF